MWGDGLERVGSRGLPRVRLNMPDDVPAYLEQRLDEGRNLIDWAHSLKVLARICNRCGFVRLHAPATLGRTD